MIRVRLTDLFHNQPAGTVIELSEMAARMLVQTGRAEIVVDAEPEAEAPKDGDA